MQVVIQSRPTEAPKECELVEGRLLDATRRQASWLSRIVVRLKDINGPRGGVDKQCQIQLYTASGGVLVASSRAANWRSALDMAIARALHNLLRWLDARKRPHGKARPTPLQAASNTHHTT